MKMTGLIIKSNTNNNHEADLDFVPALPTVNHKEKHLYPWSFSYKKIFMKYIFKFRFVHNYSRRLN